MFHNVFLGINRHPKKFIAAVGFGWATLWTALEPLFTLLDIKISGYNFYYIVGYLILSILISFIVIYPKKQVKFSLKNTNTKIEIVFGDLFTMPGNKAFAVDEFFNSTIGKPVAEKSVQGVFIKKILGGHNSILDNAEANQLNGIGEIIANRNHGKNIKYEIGTTIVVKHSNSLYFLFAMANSDEDCNTSSTPSLVLKALDGLWNKVRKEGNGNDLNIPLVGDGLSRVGLPKSQLLQLILISILKSTKEKELSSTIRIVLLQEIFDKIDLTLIKENWD